jgi:hypothetical protein
LDSLLCGDRYTVHRVGAENMTLAEVLNRIQTQLRLTPIISEDQVIDMLQQSVQRFCLGAQVLERWTIIPIKEGAAQYWLPANHQSTISVYYDGDQLQRCNQYDAQLVSPTEPVYYYEDEWSDDASEYLSTAFLTQYALMPELMLQWLAREQSAKGRKTITLVAAPTTDGDYSIGGAPPIGIVWGNTSDPTVVWGSGVGIAVAAYTVTGNLLVIYKYRDQIPSATTDDITWHDGVAVGYMCGALSIALSTETDEYDRYRSWLYGQMSDALAASMRGLAINRRLR